VIKQAGVLNLSDLLMEEKYKWSEKVGGVSYGKSGGDERNVISADKSDDIVGNTKENAVQIPAQDENSKLDVTLMKNPCEDMRQNRDERRWSERVLKNTMDKLQEENAADKDKNGGNCCESNSFSNLGAQDIIDRSLNMGVTINNDALPVIDMLAELEKARICLYKKTLTQTSSFDDIILSDNSSSGEERVPSESNGFTVVRSRRDRKTSKETISFWKEKDW
jgi:hypothetical protein